MQLPVAALWSGTLLWLRLSIAVLPCCSGLSDGDVWSGDIWNKAQIARDKHPYNSDRLMQHIWQQPERAGRFVDCDILADSETERHFQFVNLYDADDAREDQLAGLPAEDYVRGLWPLKDGVSTVPFKISDEVDTAMVESFEMAASRWNRAANVRFVSGSQKPYLEVVLDGGCFATLGYHETEPRRLSLHPGRCTETVIVHLLGHVLGLPHPTSVVGRTTELYLMPHHAAPRSMGVLRTRAGAPFDPFDIMAVDPWFCGVSNRSTWRPLRPTEYRWAGIAGLWTAPGEDLPERRSASTGLLQREIRRRAGPAAVCGDRCLKCREFMKPNCQCVGSVEMTEKRDRFDALPFAELDMGSKNVTITLLDSPFIRVLFHSTNVQDLHVSDDSPEKSKCWQCTMFLFELHTGDLFKSKENRLIALGSRCTLFSLELNSPLEEAWYRLCMHDLLHNDKGTVQLAFRGPASVLVRYVSSREVFPEFHKSFKENVNITWKADSTTDCRCSEGPEAEIQYSMDK